MTDLVACPLCGAAKGYKLADGSTFRWWNVQCAACGESVGECRSDGYAKMDDPKPERDAGADETWQAAGAYAHGMLTELSALRAERDAMREWIEEAVGYVGCETWSPSLKAEGEQLLNGLSYQVQAKLARAALKGE